MTITPSRSFNSKCASPKRIYTHCTQLSDKFNREKMSDFLMIFLLLNKVSLSF